MIWQEIGKIFEKGFKMAQIIHKAETLFECFEHMLEALAEKIL